MSKRLASHAGSWYEDDEGKLRAELDSYFNKIKSVSTEKEEEESYLKAIISPHAGYSYSGQTAAYSFDHLKKNKDIIERIIILGPSHHVYLEKCALTKAEYLSTPLGDLQVDTDLNKELMTKGDFIYMNQDVDEDEHSIEMQLPYIALALGEERLKKVKVCEIMVGNLKPKQELYYGKILANYLKDEKTVFVCSSDFAHWGKRFSFTHYNKKDGEIFESIKALDFKGIDLIINKDFKGFSEYLKESKNTICGRHAISILLGCLEEIGIDTFKVNLLHYAQSSQVKSMNESSVSYCAALISSSKLL